ncbi:MAG: AbrB/MazE/SpoVT family DNA-binding domain-containing protein [Gammaproteobacteria bacterium]
MRVKLNHICLTKLLAVLYMLKVNVLAKGQIVIPAEIRQRLGIKPGTAVELREAEDHFEIFPLPADPIAAFRGSLKAAPSLADPLIGEHAMEVRDDGDS